MQVTVSFLTIISMLMGSVPWASILVYAEAPVSSRPSREMPRTEDAPTSQAEDLPVKLYLPVVMRDYRAPLPPETIIKPGVGGEIGSPDGKVQVLFHPEAVTQTVRVRYESVDPPTLPPDDLGVGGPAFDVSAWTLDGDPVHSFPPIIEIITDTNPWISYYTPTVKIFYYYTPEDVEGLDVGQLYLYTRDSAEESWEEVPSAPFLEEQVLEAHVEHLSQFVPMAPVAARTGMLALNDASSSELKLALDPDDDVGHAYWPGEGEVREGPTAFRLAEETQQQFEDNDCQLDILITRASSDQRFVDRSLRASRARGFEADTFNTLAFNALTGSPWGVEGDGGVRAWARLGHTDDDALATEFFNRIQEYTGRPHTQAVHHPSLYTEFNNPTVIPDSMTYAHIETLFLDHNFDWPVIDTEFDLIVDATYAALATRLGEMGLVCGDDPNQPPPIPAPPSAEVLQRLRDLGYQNYQRYGADPVSFSTGNHVVQVRLLRVPGRGGMDFDLTLTYNAQDVRDDLLGYGWSFPYNARAQRYSDDSVTVALADGRTYHYTWNGSGYDAPAGVHARLEATDQGWDWITPLETTLAFSETVGGFGILTERRDRQGNALHFDYDLSGQDNWKDDEDVPRPPLTAITDDAGRTIDVQTNAETSHITRLDVWDGRSYSFTYDDAGNLTRIDGPDGQLRRFAYDSRHRMIKEWDAEDYLYLQSVYDDRDRVIEQIDADGTHSYLAYDPGERTTTFTDNLGHEEVYNWDDLNRVTGEQDAEGNQVANTYDEDYNLITRTDANGNTTRYAYDARGNLTARYDPIPPNADYETDVTRWAYDEHNQVISKTNALGQTWQYEYDADGNLIRVLRPDGTETTATYNAWGQPLTLTDAKGRTTEYVYDDVGNLTETRYPDGTTTSSDYDAAGREIAYTDANGHTVEFKYDDRDNITRIVDPKGVESRFEYDANDLLVRSVDRRGSERHYRYDANLKLIAERDAEDRWTRYEYDALYRRAARTDTAGDVTRYTYDDAGRLTAVTDPIGVTTRYAYDANGNQTAVIDAEGNRTRMIYDAADRLKYRINANGARTEYCYNAEDQLVRTIGPRGEVTDYTYDALGRLIAVKDPLGNVTRYVHDDVGNRTAVVDPLDHRTDYAYDAMDRVTAIERPALADGRRPTTQFAYDDVGNTTVITDTRGHTTAYTYDENDNVVTITDPLGGETKYAYDAEGNPVAVTDARDHTVTTTYDLVGNPVQIEDAMGYTTTMTYDDDYNLATRTNAAGQTTSYAYDPQGRLLQETDPLGHATTYEHDALGRVTTSTDANEHTMLYTYDPVGNLIAVTDALSGTTRYVYDEVSNLTVITDANDSMTRFEYNFLNQLKREINPLDNTWEYWYDDAGRLVRRRDAMWHATYYDYDSNGRLVEISYGVTPETMHPVTFTYDLAGNETGMCDGLLALSGVEGGCTTHAYDALGRRTRTTDWLGRVITRTYDAVGNMTGLTYPNKYQVQYAYDANNRLTAFTDPHGESSSYQRNALGQVTRLEYPNNTVAAFTYDDVGRLTGIDNRRQGAAQPQSAYEYGMDKVGNRVEVVETRAPFDGSGDPVELVHTYTYDALDRLIGAATDEPPSETTYAFDTVGNRLRKSGTVLAPDPGVPELPVAPEPEQTAYTYNAANQLTEVDGSDSTTALDYNANGDRVRETEVLTDGTTLITDYAYDREDRLTGVTKSVSDTAALTVTMVATYTYDGYGRRARKAVAYPDAITSTQVITYLYDGLDIIGAQLEQNGTVTETTYYLAPSPVTGMRRPLEMERLPNPATGFAGDRHWYQTDGLDSVVALTDESGDLASPFLYDEYGQLLAGTTALQLFAYTGQDYDVETGLYHFYARYYDPSVGVWLTQDAYRGVKGLAGTLHRYNYVNDNPITTFDFLGYVDSSCPGWDPGSCPVSGEWGTWNQDKTGYYVYLDEEAKDRLTGSEDDFDQLTDEIGDFFSESESLDEELRLSKEQVREQLALVREKALADANLSGANTIDFSLKYYPTKDSYLWIRPWGNNFNPYGGETAASNWVQIEPTPEQLDRCGTIFAPPFEPETYKSYGQISSGYGRRTLEGKSEFHRGVDFSWSGVAGVVVVAISHGKVEKAGTTSGFGNRVEIEHSGYHVVYAHLSSYCVSKDDEVRQGDKIGKVGSTGRSTGYHLHLEIRSGGYKTDVNPFPLIPEPD